MNNENPFSENIPSLEPFEIKEASGSKMPTFKGYGAVYGNRDDGFDVLEAGVFKKARTKRNGKIRILAYHDTTKVVGEAEFTQDQKGLLIDGTINLDLPGAAGIYAGMKDGGLDAMSVGFSVLKNGARWDEEKRARYITKAELWEVSIVPFGMNSKARITSVKNADAIEDIGQFETWLRSHGFSRKRATMIASHGFRNQQREAADSTSERLAIAKAIKSIFN